MCSRPALNPTPPCHSHPFPSHGSPQLWRRVQPSLHPLAPPSCPCKEKAAGVTCPGLSCAEAFTPMCLEFCLMREVGSDNDLFALSFDFDEATRPSMCYFWQVASFRRVKCLWLQCTGQVLGPQLPLPPNQGRKESKATPSWVRVCQGWGVRSGCVRGPRGCLF